ncbi:beta-galactosidase GalA [Flavihumibacter petaseus]|uniref:Putative beta-galactosidase n=1 Tax=Flavihumibacter petaseus NBRC 106054 TaxID=1220578 RepID=A0A0E9MTW0_9BACT|nr:beta-galactosidase GalA [Flavihumibacter petaseus]GAO40999.1 putative beta-galactosidase [Flavihumibacter petaseus NBRC 106054]
MRLYSLILFVFFAALTIQASAQRSHELFDEGWRFAFGHAALPEKDFSYSLRTVYSKSGGATGTAIDPAFNDSSWRKLDLPHDWAVELPFVQVDSKEVESHGYKAVGGLFPATSIGWYRKHFVLSPADSGRRFEIQFDGIFRDAQVWINGFYLGNNKSGYLGVNYDVTDFLFFHKENIITVRVDASQYEGWFYEGAGIYRHVWLNSFVNAHITTDGIFAHAEIAGERAALTVETTIATEGVQAAGDSPVEVVAYLTDRDGRKLATGKPVTTSLRSGNSRTFIQQINVKQPRIWTLEDPYLHRVVVELKKNGKLIDRQQLRFGFRSIELRTNGVYLNGKHLKILGTNNHQDHAGLGAALPDYLQYYRIQLLKEMGSNAFRTSHNAPTPELLDACDSLGMLVLDEQRLLNSGPEYLGQFERLVKRDRSRTSVFLWSIGNEEGFIQGNSTGRLIAGTLMRKLKQLDPTRTSTYAADMANVYPGVNEVIPIRSFNYRQFAVADYHRDHPQQPLLGTEMGSTVTTRGIWKKDTVRAYLPDQDITAPWWASRAEEWWQLAANADFWLGGFIWTGFDYRGEPTPYSWPNISSHFGVMDACGFPKNIYYYYQSWWRNKDVLHISPHWNEPVPVGEQTEVWVNSNADTVTLFLNGKNLGSKAMPRNSHLRWTVQYEPGKLEAVAVRHGREIRTVVETTGAAAAILLKPSKTTLTADGKDAVVVNVIALDSQGREVPDAGNMIRFALEGDAKIIGVGNGDPSSHEPDHCVPGAWQRSLFSGKCQVILQAGKTTGKVKLTAISPGLTTASVEF